MDTLVTFEKVYIKKNNLIFLDLFKVINYK